MFVTTVDDLAMTFSGMALYLFFDAVHLMKYFQNNLLNRKLLLFPELFSNSEVVDFTNRGGEISWSLFLEAYEKDQTPQAKPESC